MYNVLIVFSTAIDDPHTIEDHFDEDFDYIITDDDRVFGDKVIHLSGIGKKDLITIDHLSPITEFSYNDIDKFVLNPLSEIILEIEARSISRIVLYKGGKTITLPSVISEHVESKHRILTSKADVFNPLLFTFLKDSYEVSWIKKCNSFLCNSRVLLRALTLFMLSIGEAFRNRTKLYSAEDKTIVVRSKLQESKMRELFRHPLLVRKKISFKSLFNYFSNKSVFDNSVLCYDGKKHQLKGFWINIEYFSLVDSMARKFKIDSLNSQDTLITFESSSRFALIDATFTGDIHNYQLTDLPFFLKLKKMPYDRFYVKDQKSMEYLVDIGYTGSVEVFKWPRKSFEKDVSRLLVCTQPYGQDILDTWLSDLVELDPKLKEQIVLRRHPRDHFKYSKIQSWVKNDNVDDAEESLARSFIIIGLSTTMLNDAHLYDSKAVSVNVDERTKIYNESMNNENILLVSSVEQLHDVVTQ